MTIRKTAFAIVAMIFVVGSTNAKDLQYKQYFLNELASKVPKILKSFDAETGRFGSGIWECRDQHPMYALAVAYATPGSRYFHDEKLLHVIVKAGDLLIKNTDAEGRWIYQKKDGSTWGMTWMPWTYSRWIRTFELIQDRMPLESRVAWSRALTLGYTWISKNLSNSEGNIHNISTHQSMGLYIACKTLDHPAWCQQATDYLMKVVNAQSEAGYWSEGGGPVVLYNFEYVEALGIYYAVSGGNQQVLNSLEKSAAFHRHFTYPDGKNIETIDQRNAYRDKVETGNVGFTFSAVGRSYLQNQWSHLVVGNLSPDLIASFLVYGREGPIEENDAGKQTFVLTEGGIDRAAIVRDGPWFIAVSAYTAPIGKSRWSQDRQNIISIYHEKTGLIIGGGNTKLQPAWSNFTIGDTNLLSYSSTDENPDFLPKGELYHVPSAAELILEPETRLDLTYGPEINRIRVRPENDHSLVYQIESTAESTLSAEAHLTLMPHLHNSLETGGGQKVSIDTEPITLSAEQVGGQITYAGYLLHLPTSASLRWPALPFNSYRKDGHAEPSEGRIEIRIPFDQQHRQYFITIEIPET